MALSKPAPGSGHGEHNGWRDVMASEGCPLCRATIIPAGNYYAKSYRTFGDMVDNNYYGKKEEKVSQYIIWNPKAAEPPTVVHDSRPTAIKVAYQMSAREPGAEFYICKLVGRVTAPEPKPHHTTLDDG